MYTLGSSSGGGIGGGGGGANEGSGRSSIRNEPELEDSCGSIGGGNGTLDFLRKVVGSLGNLRLLARRDPTPGRPFGGGHTTELWR